MQKIKAIILSLVFIALMFGASTQAAGPSIMMMVKKGGSSSAFCTGFSGLLCEDIEGSSSCGDDSLSQTTCRASWTKANNGTITNIGTGIAGSYSKKLDDDADDSNNWLGTYSDFTANGTVHAFALIKIAAETITSGNPTILSIRSATHSAYCDLRVTGATNKFAVLSSGGTTTDTTVTPTANTVYGVWLDYSNNKSDGTGCVVRISSSVTCSGSPASCSVAKPASANAGINTGNWGNVSRLQFGSDDSNSFGDVDWVYFDNIKVSTSAIGDNGQ